MELSANIKHDFRILHMLYAEANKKDLDANTTIQAIKKRIRNTLSVEAEYKEINPRWHYNETCDYRWCKIVYNGLPDDETEIKEYKEDMWQHWYNPYEDGRDCTGVWFTTGIDVFPIKTENKTIVFHFQACDI